MYNCTSTPGYVNLTVSYKCGVGGGLIHSTLLLYCNFASSFYFHFILDCCNLLEMIKDKIFNTLEAPVKENNSRKNCSENIFIFFRTLEVTTDQHRNCICLRVSCFLRINLDIYLYIYIIWKIVICVCVCGNLNKMKRERWFQEPQSF